MPEQESNDVARAVWRMEGKLDQVINNQKEFHERHEKMDKKIDAVKEHVVQEVSAVNARVGKMENKIHWYSGAIAAAFTIFTFFGDSIRALFR